MQLIHRESFDFAPVASLAWDAELCGLWVASDRPQLFLITADGREMRVLQPGMMPIRAVTVEPDGLLIADGWGTFQRIDRDGQSLGAPYMPQPRMTDVEGMHRDIDGTLWIVEDDGARLLHLAPDGTRLMEKRGVMFEPKLDEPQGVARDPLSGNILMVDDNEGMNALIEATPEGEILSVIPLSEWGMDAEGVAVHAQTGTLFVGFDTGRRIAVFDYLPTMTDAAQPFSQGPDCPIS